ncbi:MAG: hypothetical protein AB8F94_02380, partial [Saprospiraceae bacterium]
LPTESWNNSHGVFSSNIDLESVISLLFFEQVNMVTNSKSRNGKCFFKTSFLLTPTQASGNSLD